MFKTFVFLAVCSAMEIPDSQTVPGSNHHQQICSDCKRTTRDDGGKSNLTVWPEFMGQTNNRTGFLIPNTQNIVGDPAFQKHARDPRFPRNLYMIGDRDRPGGCTLLATKYKKGAFTYLTPSWRKNGFNFWLKAWNPDVYEGFILSVASMDKAREYRLTIGNDENEKIELSYSDDSGKSVLLKERTLPHLVPTGKWAGYWLRAGNGRIQLGNEGVKRPFFEWVAAHEAFTFRPGFINFGTTKEAWLGMGLKCSECLVEETSVNNENKIYPINLWSENDDRPSSLKLNLRGTGSAIVTLMWNPDLNRSLFVEIDAYNKNISLLQYLSLKNYRTIAAYNVDSAISANKWSEYLVSFTEKDLTINKEGKVLVNWESPLPLFFRWFSVSAREGSINWAANCPPPDIDGEPRNGNWGAWGPWTCSVSCGRGEGRLERKCDRPSPNIFGEDCSGSSVYEGPCNDFPCGDITPETYQLIRRHLSTRHQSLEVEAKDRVEIGCNPAMIPLVLKEAKDLNVTWSHNGLKSERTRFLVNENFTLVIPRAQEKHNGVYLCTVHQGPYSVPSKVVIEVVSLIVKRKKPTRKVRKGNSMTLKCNGWALSQVYDDLSYRWELNGTPWKQYGMGVIEMLATDKLENVDDLHAGVWTCVVTQEDFKFKWTTNWINLKVKTAPNFWYSFMEDLMTAVPILPKGTNERKATIMFICLIVFLVWIILILICILIRVLEKC